MELSGFLQPDSVPGSPAAMANGRPSGGLVRSGQEQETVVDFLLLKEAHAAIDGDGVKPS